jgi:hypothetical protein
MEEGYDKVRRHLLWRELTAMPRDWF